MYLDIKSWSKS